MSKPIDIIRQAALDQTFFDRLAETENQSLRDAEMTFGRVQDACENRAAAANRAYDLCANNRWDELANDMSAGIIALNEACKVLNIPAHERTALAVQQWGDN